MKKLYILLILITFLLSSCSKTGINKNYIFVVKNETKYNLDKVKFDWCNNDNFITISPNSVSPEITLTYKITGYNLFDSGSLCVTVESYSDSISNFENNEGHSITRTVLDTKKINTIILTEISDTLYQGTNPFKIKLN